MSAQVITVKTMMKAVSVQKALALVCRVQLPSVEAIVHVTIVMKVAISLARVVTSLARADMASVHRVVVMVSVLRAATSSVRVAMAVLSRVAMANLMDQHPIRKDHVSIQPTMIRMQSIA